jgi:hypothetical protein
MKREEVLALANEAVMKSRNQDYGDPKDNLGHTADLWSVYKGVNFSAADVAMMMVLLKLSRMAKSPQKADHYVDVAGWAACGAECADAE